MVSIFQTDIFAINHCLCNIEQLPYPRAKDDKEKCRCRSLSLSLFLFDMLKPEEIVKENSGERLEIRSRSYANCVQSDDKVR